MSPVELKLIVADATPAVLTLPQPLAAQTVQTLELARAAGESEYASWLPDAAALEYASWMAQLLTARR